MIPELIFYIIDVISTMHCAQHESFNFRYQLSQPKRANYKRKTNITSHWMLEHHVSLHRALSGTCMRHDGFFFPPVPSHAGWSTIQNVGDFSPAQERTEFHCRVSHFNVTKIYASCDKCSRWSQIKIRCYNLHPIVKRIQEGTKAMMNSLMETFKFLFFPYDLIATEWH